MNERPPARGAPDSVRLVLGTSAIGRTEIPPLPDHQLIVHAGPPARGSCQRHRYRYTRGEIDIMPAGMSWSWTNDDPRTSVVVAISPSLMRRAADEMGLDPDRAGVAVRHQIRDPRIEHVVWALEAEDRLGYPGGRLYADSLGLALTFHMLGSYAAQAHVRAGLSADELGRVTDYIEDHIDRDLSLSQLARVLAISPSHLKTQFKRSTGLAVHEYVLRRRVARAKQLLVRGELPASQIALEAGFAHQSHMARWMRRILGVTPSAIGRGGPIARPDRTGSGDNRTERDQPEPGLCAGAGGGTRSR